MTKILASHALTLHTNEKTTYDDENDPPDDWNSALSSAQHIIDDTSLTTPACHGKCQTSPNEFLLVSFSVPQMLVQNTDKQKLYFLFRLNANIRWMCYICVSRHDSTRKISY